MVFMMCFGVQHKLFRRYAKYHLDSKQEHRDELTGLHGYTSDRYPLSRFIVHVSSHWMVWSSNCWFGAFTIRVTGIDISMFAALAPISHSLTVHCAKWCFCSRIVVYTLCCRQICLPTEIKHNIHWFLLVDYNTNFVEQMLNSERRREKFVVVNVLNRNFGDWHWTPHIRLVSLLSKFPYDFFANWENYFGAGQQRWMVLKFAIQMHTIQMLDDSSIKRTTENNDIIAMNSRPQMKFNYKNNKKYFFFHSTCFVGLTFWMYVWCSQVYDRMNMRACMLVWWSISASQFDTIHTYDAVWCLCLVLHIWLVLTMIIWRIVIGQTKKLLRLGDCARFTLDIFFIWQIRCICGENLLLSLHLFWQIVLAEWDEKISQIN